MIKLTKSQRFALLQTFGGRCAYCGQELGPRWHADHFEPAHRRSAWDSEKGRMVATGECRAEGRDNLENLMPACPACNIDKSVLSLEEWRARKAPTRHRCVDPQQPDVSPCCAVWFGAGNQRQSDVLFRGAK